jgi:hypothetical protein
MYVSILYVVFFRWLLSGYLTDSILFLTEKLAEAQRKFATLHNELQSSLDAQKESTGVTTLRQRRKPVFHLSHEERVQHRNIKDLKLAFSELYLSLILLQNYQVLKSLTPESGIFK